jgi:hypothetical protein
MSTSSPSPQWRPLPSSSLVDVLYADEDIEDIVALSGASTPEWLQRLSVPMNWQLVGLPDVPDQPTARMAVCGPLGKGEWEAADTISVFGFTGWPAFYDVFRNADRTLRRLNASAIAVQVLPVPAIQWVAAVRSSGVDPADQLCRRFRGAPSGPPHCAQRLHRCSMSRSASRGCHPTQ